LRVRSIKNTFAVAIATVAIVCGSVTAVHADGDTADEVASLVTTVVADDSQADTFTYPVGGDVTPVLNPDGSVSVLKPFSATDPETGEEVTGAIVVAEVAVPWALDAEGKEVATYFEVTDEAIIQVVERGDAGVVFPVVAQNSSPKRCLQMTITNTIVTAPIPWFSTYPAGGYCR